MIRRPPRSTLDRSSAASDVYKRQSLPYAKTAQLSPYKAKVLEDLKEAVNEMALIKAGKLKGRNACLLYTSPSPRDRTRSRMPSSA
mgnify:CR=1 FL=1